MCEVIEMRALPARSPFRFHVTLSVMGAFVGATLCWILWCVFETGDFAGGSVSPLVIAAAGALIYGVLGLKTRSRTGSIVLATVTVLCVVFWIAAPDGWWAIRPPSKATGEVHLRWRSSSTVNHLTEHGVVEASLLYQSPFTDFKPRGPHGLFTSAQVDELIAVLDRAG